MEVWAAGIGFILLAGISWLFLRDVASRMPAEDHPKVLAWVFSHKDVVDAGDVPILLLATCFWPAMIVGTLVTIAAVALARWVGVQWERAASRAAERWRK